ncbi:MAG: glycosyltransferase family 2 protein [Bacteroidales bacterium]|nr:glycosyltransferase family 2 protein [Bacteroidales bacterium]
MQNYKLSVVITVYNEEFNIAPLVEQLELALKDINHEVLFVDDGSTDNSVAEILKAKQSRPHFKLIQFRRNYGQSSAIAAGIDHAQGAYISTIDGDLQNDPSDIPWMLEMLENSEFDVVAGRRANRQDKAFTRKIPSLIANWIIRRATKLTIEDYGCTLRVFRSEIAKGMGLYGELHRFIPILAHLQGARIHQVDVKHHPRIHGQSKYGLNRTFKVLSDLILMLFINKYMPKPMHLFGGLGLLLTGAGIAINLYMLILKILGEDIWGRPLLMLGILTFIAGVQFITFGIMAEIQMRTYYESQDKKHYSIRRVL